MGDKIQTSLSHTLKIKETNPNYIWDEFEYDLAEAIKTAVLDERSACLKIAQSVLIENVPKDFGSNIEWLRIKSIADRIRDRPELQI